MRIVLDTNVLVSGLLSPHGPPGIVVDLVGAGAHRVCFDARILAEYRDVFMRPRFALSPRSVETALARLVSFGYRLTATPLSIKLPDPDDLPFLEVAVAAEADHLLSGNKKYFPAKLCRGISVVSPREFLNAIGEQMASERDSLQHHAGFMGRYPEQV